jgi:hypothetical protein
MAVIVALSIAFWLSVTAYRVVSDRQSQRICHLWERHAIFGPGSVYNSGHPAPFWPRYWRRLFGQPWLGTYACDPSAESYSRFGRLAATVSAPSLGDDLTPVHGRIPENHSGNRLIAEYYSKYVPQHWKKDADGIWSAVRPAR